MPANPAEIPGFFGHGEVGFVCDPANVPCGLPNTVSVAHHKFKETLIASGRLPPLGTAPVSSWVLARLAKLCGRRFPFEYGQVYGSDGNDWWMSFICFSTEPAIRPTGKVSLIGDRKQIGLRITVAPPHSVAQIREAFLEALLESPTQLGRTCLIVAYSSLEDEEHWKHVPYALGWDGKDFIDRDAPEHTITEEDCA